MEDENLLEILEEFIKITNRIIRKLNEELEWIKGHHNRCRAAKSVGTVASVGGAAFIVGSLVLAPFTGGASIVAATGYGALVATAGGAINVATDLTDLITQRIENSQIKDICSQRDGVTTRLKKKFAEIERIASQLKESNIDEDDAHFLAFKKVATTSTSIALSTKNVIKLARCAQIAKGASNMCLRNGGYMWKAMRLQSQTLMKAMAYFGFNVTKRGAMAIIRTGTVVLNGAFAIFDVYSLIQTMTNNHPTADSIAQLIEKIEEEMQEIQELRKFATEIVKFSNMKTARFNCPHCSRSLVWEKQNYEAGAVIVCSYRDCQKKFNHLTCPHCSGSMFWKNANYEEGVIVTCPHDNCKKKFNHLTCPGCCGSIFWKNANYVSGSTVTCPYDNCKTTFD